MNAIGFNWNPGASTTAATRDDSFFTRVDELRAYKEKHGHLNVRRKDDEGLYDFCNTLRQARLGKGNYRLDDGQIAALDAIGFDYWNMGVPIDQVDKLYKVANVDKQKYPTELSVQPPSTEAGVSSRGRTRKMSQAMAESVSQQDFYGKQLDAEQELDTNCTNHPNVWPMNCLTRWIHTSMMRRAIYGTRVGLVHGV